MSPLPSLRELAQHVDALRDTPAIVEHLRGIGPVTLADGKTYRIDNLADRMEHLHRVLMQLHGTLRGWGNPTAEPPAAQRTAPRSVLQVPAEHAPPRRAAFTCGERARLNAQGNRPDGLLTLGEVKAATGKGHGTLYYLIGQGKFPKPTDYAGRSPLWTPEQVAPHIPRKA